MTKNKFTNQQQYLHKYFSVFPRNNHLFVCANVTLPGKVVELSKTQPKIKIKAD